jgi:glycosyltransferase involved in cell wall biosynthesis
MKAKARVSILQRRLVQYRVSLFERLRAECEAAGIELRVVYGAPSPSDAKRNDNGHLSWGDEVRSRWFSVRGTELLWQSCPREVRESDLIVLTQENKILSNYPFLANRSLPFGSDRPKLAFWGHGRNLQSQHPDGLSERWKQLLLTKVDWWFAYTEGVKAMLVDQGYPASQITSLENAIDNEAFAADLAAVPDDLLARFRSQIDLAPGAPLGLFCGALYADKRIELLVEVADRIHEADPSFRLVVVGDGPYRPELDRLIADKPWASCVGATYGVDKAAWFRLATVQLNPGLVGLHILDSFTSGVPLFTTSNARHAPEIDYLDNGRNGFIVDDDPETMARAVLDLIEDPARLERVVAAGREAAGHYTLANMTTNFVTGIVECLARPDPPR